MKRKILGLILSGVLVLAASFSVNAAESEKVNDISVQENASNAYDELMAQFVTGYSDVSEKSYPDYYGGSYINEDGQLVVYITENKDTALALSENDNVIYESCKYSYNELLSVMDELNSYKLRRSGDTIASNFNEFGLYDSENRVIVKLDNLSNESIAEFKENVCDSDAIEFEQGYGPIKTEVSVTAGSKISYSGGSASVGYRVKKDGVVGFVTAGHAANSVGKTINYNGTAFATCQATQQGGNADAGFCKITNSSYSPTNTLSGTSNVLSTTISEPGVGTTINKIGMSTGHTSGTILSTNVTATFDTGATISNLTTANYSSAAGDSGGVVYSYISSTGARLTLGIHTGASNDGVTRYYTKANEVNSALGTTRYWGDIWLKIMYKRYNTIFAVFLGVLFLSGCGNFDSKNESLFNATEDANTEEESIVDSNSSVYATDDVILDADTNISNEMSNNSMLGDDNISYIPSVDTDSAIQIENNKSDDDLVDDRYATKLEGKVIMMASVDSEGNLAVTVTNNSDGIIEMGKEFSIMKEESGTWLDIPLHMGFSDDLISVESNESYVFNYNIGTFITLESDTSYQVEKEVFAGEKKCSVSAFIEVQ